ncbi:TatD family hydrolase [Corynebacterium sp. MC-04]|uniref:TatD family hydrolase n=1 Tax=Corynebacterium parakroppenstedtii TaxID=2828363 RepID=UPI001EEFB118|nr:TatD family hydrolase [Corynebacterium parakroppenstedtii]MCF6809516.1 TatD family hydrolase [Corynebacterium parakroppenstedtii]MCF6813485.1 TatD family hydrolase [Corynebacterium parakroppenstedtii]
MSKKRRPEPKPPEFLPHLVDAHTHLWATGAHDAAGISELMTRAAGSGVEWVCTVGDGLDEAEKALEAAHLHPDVVAACAIHPTRAGELTDSVRARIEEMAEDPRCVAVGETGLDYYWLGKLDECADKDTQREALRWHADLARRVNKPLMIHNREGDEDLLAILADYGDDLTVMLHCFSSPLEVAEEALSRGYILSFAGYSTFKRNDELREAARRAPVGQITVETDAPYMTPEPFRGAKNESAYVGYTARRLAEVRGESPEEFALHTGQTTARIFGMERSSSED